MKSAGTPNEASGVAKNAVVDEVELEALDGGIVVVLACGFAGTSRHIARKATSSTPAGMSELGRFMSILGTFEIRTMLYLVASHTVR